MTVLRDTQVVIETLADVTAKLRPTQIVIETLADVTANLRVTQIVVETLCSNDDTTPSGNYRFFFGS